jgi:hypothetical protein
MLNPPNKVELHTYKEEKGHPRKLQSETRTTDGTITETTKRKSKRKAGYIIRPMPKLAPGKPTTTATPLSQMQTEVGRHQESSNRTPEPANHTKGEPSEKHRG